MKPDRKLLERLVCPVTKTRLEYDAKAGELISNALRKAFAIRDGIPVMLVSEARSLDDDAPTKRQPKRTGKN